MKGYQEENLKAEQSIKSNLASQKLKDKEISDLKR